VRRAEKFSTTRTALIRIMAVASRMLGRLGARAEIFMTFQLSAIFDRIARRLRFMPWRHGLQLALQGTVVLGLAALCLLVLAWLTLQWGILPHIEDWRPAIERHASKAVGVPVRIGHISVRSSGWVPALELRDVVLLDPAGPEALRLPRVSAALSPRSLLVLSPRLSQLYIEDAHLLVRRDAQGGIHVAGIDIGAARPASSTAVDQTPALDWFFSQEEFVLRHGNVRWVDEQRAAPPLELADVDLVVRNGLRSHAMRLDATPPAAWGDRFNLRAGANQPLFAHAGDWRRWTGTFYADLPRGDMARLKDYVDLPFELDGGQGALRLWLDFQTNGWRGATADVRLQGVGLRLSPGLKPLAIASAAGRLTAERTSAGVSFGAERFGFETADGIIWPRGNLSLGWYQRQTMLKPAQAMPARNDWRSASAVEGPSSGTPTVLWDTDHPVTGGHVTADALDLTLMRRLAGSLPLPEAAQRWLADYQPAGVVKGLSLRWDGPIDAPAHYRATAAIDGFSMAAGALSDDASTGRPGWRNASVRFDANEAGGTARLALDDGAIELPGVFDDPVIPFDRFAASASWTISRGRETGRPAAVSLALHDVRFANADAEGELQLDWHTGPAGPAGAASAPAFGRGHRFPGQMDLKGELSRGRASQVARYLPRTLPESTRRYLHDAFPSGDLDNVHFAVRGDLADFPYTKHDGEFRIAGHVADATLNYVPGPAPADGGPAGASWPVFTQVDGEIVIEHGGLEIRHAEAHVGEVALHDVHGGFRSLYEQQTLALQGRAAGPMPDFLRYVAQSPVGGWLGNGLATTTATGSAELVLALTIPLAHIDQSTVNGSLVLPGNDVRLLPDVPVLANARARVDFTQRGVTVSGGAARALGGDLLFDGGTQADGALRFVAQGSATAEGLRRAVDESALARLAGRLGGQTSYRLQIGIVKGQVEIAVASPLTGLALALPAPLDKPAEASWPLKVASAVSFDAQGRPRDTWRVELGNPASPLVQAEVVRDLGGPVPRPLRTAYAVGAPLPAPQPDGVAVLRVGALDADAWWAALRALKLDAATTGTISGSGNSPAPATSAWWPATASLKAQDLLLGGRHLTAADLQLSQTVADTTEGWRLSVSSDQTHGLVEYRPDTAAHGAQVFARLDRLALDSHEAGTTDNAGAGASQPAARQQGSVPALDIVVDSFELNAKKLGKLEVSATSQAGGRDWRLTRLALTTPEARFTGTGQWSGAPLRHAALDFKLELADSGAFLERLGLGSVLKGGKGELSGAVSWTGSPLELDYPTLGGQLQVALDKGQFLKANAGAARLLGVLSLQALPRRLTLDFRDLFQEGFAFDNVTGDVQIDKGVASTNNLRMRGVSAVVLMEGSADLHAETQDLRVIVVPEINAGAAALAYAAINPVIGLGTFLAQWFLRNPLMQANTKEFHIAGNWADPKVEEVAHKAPAAPAASAPVSAATPTASASEAATVSR
jgi:uncharacterized protein (TIGR02099 family)